MISSGPWKAVFHGMVNSLFPWRIADVNGDTVISFGAATDESLVKRIVLEHNANEIAVRRKWWTVPWGGYFADNPSEFVMRGWCVMYADQRGSGVSEKMVMPSIADCAGHPDLKRYHDDPATALVETEKWYVENKEAKKQDGV